MVCLVHMKVWAGLNFFPEGFSGRIRYMAIPASRGCSLSLSTATLLQCRRLKIHLINLLLHHYVHFFPQTHIWDANMIKGSFTFSQSFMQLHLPYFYCVIYKEANLQRDDEWEGTWFFLHNPLGWLDHLGTLVFYCFLELLKTPFLNETWLLNENLSIANLMVILKIYLSYVLIEKW